MDAKVYTSAILFLIVTFSGFVLLKAGSPYPAVWFNVHKLLALAGITLIVLIVIPLLKLNSPSGLDMVLIGLTAVFMLASLITGGLLNTETTAWSLLRILHRIIPPAAIILAVITIWRLKLG